MLLWLVSIAFAEILLLSPDLPKAEAEKLSEQCAAAFEKQDFTGVEIRNSRFFVSGKGYQYRVVVAGLESSEVAKEWHQQLQTINPDFFLQIDGKDLVSRQKDPKVVEEMTEKAVVAIVPKKVLVEKSEEEPRTRRLIPSSADVLSHAQSAHSKIRTEWESTPREQFFFYRSLPQEGSLIHHRFYRSETSLRLDITIKNGEGTNSTTVLPDDDQAWIQSQEKSVARNAVRTRELLERFSSQNILSVPYHFAKDVQTSEEWDSLKSVRREGEVWRLQSKATDGLVSASFYRETWLIADIIVQEGDRTMEYEFSDYRDVDELGMIPHVVQIYDDQQMVEEIQIETLTITDQIPPQLFVKNEQ
jgi:hypothetical protein